MLKLAGFSTVIIKDLGEKDSQVHRGAMPQTEATPQLPEFDCTGRHTTCEMLSPFPMRVTSDFSSIKNPVCSTLWFPHRRA